MSKTHNKSGKCPVSISVGTAAWLSSSTWISSWISSTMGVPVSTDIIIIGIRVAMLMVVGRGRLIAPIIEGLRETVIVLAWRVPCGSTNGIIPKSWWILIIRWRLSHIHHIWGSAPNINLAIIIIIIIIIITRRHNIIHAIRHTLGELLIISVLDSSSSSSTANPIPSASAATR